MKPRPSAAVAAKFQATFKVQLFKFFHPFFGFDVVKFDEEVIKPPAGISTADHIKKAYGPEALALVEGLL